MLKRLRNKKIEFWYKSLLKLIIKFPKKLLLNESIMLKKITWSYILLTTYKITLTKI